MQRCSLTQNTKCPDSSWIDNHYYKNQKRKSFLGISVGCNKAFDAVQAMRRGSGNSKFDKSAWRHALQEASGGQVSQGVCNQESGEQFDLKNSTILENAEMHCIEPMPVTVKALQQASQQLQYDTTGFFVTHAAIAKQSGSTYFPRASLSNQAHMKVQVGSENQGMESCGNAKTAMKDPKCQEVKMYSLDDYANKFIHQSSDSAIQILSIDVEGYDYDVMLGGMNATLPRVEYLEFEYNWMGAWRSQKLQDAIQKLDLLHFSCYWAGSRGRLWRITNCFLDYFEVKHWSNVACVNRLRVPELAMEMERVFEQTLAAA
jgi:FkbM family methyltransferase